MTPEHIREQLRSILREHQPRDASQLFFDLDAVVNAAIVAEREACAKAGDDVALAHQRIGTHGRFTADYRSGATDAARHVAHLIRQRTNGSAS